MLVFSAGSVPGWPGRPGLCRSAGFLCCRYKAIVKYKTAFYSFYLPVAAAMYMVSFPAAQEVL